MADEFFESQRSAVAAQLTPGENIEDIEMMYSIILEARHQRNPSRQDDKRIGLWSLCFIGVPYKAPRYSYEIRKFRVTFIGIAFESSQQKRFRKALKPALLNAETVEALEGKEFEDLFNEASIPNNPIDPRGGGTPGTRSGDEGAVQAVVAQSSYMMR